MNGNAIPNANDQSYTPTETGDYSVEVISGDCDAKSEEYPFEVVSTESYFKSSISIYPNPASSDVVISMDASQVSALTIVTLQGAIVMSHDASNTLK